MKLDYPSIIGTDAKEQIQQLKSYLFRTIDTLNLLLSAMDDKNADIEKRVEAINEDIRKVRQEMDEQNQYTMRKITT